MKKLYLLTSLSLLVSCSAIRFSESDLKWNNSLGSLELFLINDSIVYGGRGKEAKIYLIDSCTGKVLGLIAKETVEPFYPVYGEKKYVESSNITWLRYTEKLKSPFDFDYIVTVIDYNQIFRWETRDKTDLIVTRKSDNKKKKIKFKRSIFDGVYRAIPYDKNKLLIEYATRSNRTIKIGMIDLDKLFEKQ